MALRLRRRKPSAFRRASDGSMTLMEHLRELRNRLFKAVAALVLCMFASLFIAQRVLDFLTDPYCDYKREVDIDNGIYDPASGLEYACQFNSGSPLGPFLLNLRLALFIGVIVSAPIWLYQLWAFIAPGLHRHERRYTYYFAAVAGPLFAAGAVLGFFVVSKSIRFFIGLNDAYNITVDISEYFDFVTNVMLLFGAGFEFPLIIIMLNVFGLASAKRLLGWWRIVVFLVFAFCAIVTPTPDPFGMTLLALCMVALYFAAVGFAFLNDRRRRRNRPWSEVDDDEASDIGVAESVGGPSDVDDDTPPDDGGTGRRRFDSDAT